jgi:NADPH-dependent 2,4-dienoyl-CoA reductase/sulfur reductase-like enzyme
MKFVVIGGDAAGMSAASRARRRNPSMDVIVFEKTRDVSYSACGMPYNIADPGRPMEDLIVRMPQVFRDKQNIDLRLEHEVTAINRSEKTVKGLTANGSQFEVEYDKLLIATGARPIILNMPGNNLPGVFALKSLEDGRRIKNYMADHGVSKVLVIGMGYIGLEMAEAYHTRGIEVEMVKSSSRLLPWMPEEMAEVVKQDLEVNGVKLRFGASMKAIENNGSSLTVHYDTGDPTETDMVLMGVGVQPNSEIAADAGLELGPHKAVAVDKYLRTSDADIFSAGDCADAFHVITEQRVWIPLALRANRAGWAVADNLMDSHVELPGIVGSAVFKVFDLEVCRTGLSVKEAQDAGFEPVENVITSRTRAHAHPGNKTVHVALVGDKKTGKLLGATMVGKEGAAHRINSVAVALHAGMTASEFAQCDMAYAPPFSPVWDPLLTAGNQLLKAMT